MAGIINWLIVRAPPELLRRIEIRPDCMILDDADVFWREHMSLGFPKFAPNEEGHLVMTGIYGTRHVEFLTVRRFDENDRSPEVLAAQLGAAMSQQWNGVAGVAT